MMHQSITSSPPYQLAELLYLLTNTHAAIDAWELGSLHHDIEKECIVVLADRVKCVGYEPFLS